MTFLQILAAVVLIEYVLFYVYQTKNGWITRNTTTRTMWHERYYCTRINIADESIQKTGEWDVSCEIPADRG